MTIWRFIKSRSSSPWFDDDWEKIATFFVFLPKHLSGSRVLKGWLLKQAQARRFRALQISRSSLTPFYIVKRTFGFTKPGATKLPGSRLFQ